MRISLGSAGVCNDCELSVAVGIIEGEMEGDGRLFNGRQRMNKIQLLIQLNTSSLEARLLGKRKRVVVFDTIMVRNIGLAVLVLARQDIRNVPPTRAAIAALASKLDK